MIPNVLDLHGDKQTQTKILIDKVKFWADKYVQPHIAKHWEAASFPPTILQSFRQKCPELLGLSIPKKYGGAGLDLLTSYILVATLASVDSSVATTIMVQYGLCAESILLCGTEQQRRFFLPNLSQLTWMGCFCLTEPQSGSDASDLKTIAVKITKKDPNSGKEKNGYVITGSKRWIGNALTSEVFVVWARNTSLPKNPVMGFIVQRSQQQYSNSIITKKIEGKISMRILQNADVEFHEAWCPDENVMHENVGFSKSVGRVLESSRVSVAWMPVGISMGALSHTLEFVKKRIAFNAPLSANQLVQEKLSRMAAMTSSIYLLAERVTKDFVAGKCGLPAIAMAKAHNSFVGRQIVSLAREILGGNGIVLDFQIASKFADMESVYTYEGTYDINALICGRALTGVSAIKSAVSVKNEYASKSRL